MQRLAVGVVAVLVALLLALTIYQLAHADGYEYTLRQRVVIDTIYNACDRYELTDEQCALPMFVAWRETRYGQNIYSQVDTFRGFSTSVGVYQYYAGPRGDCVGGGLACFGSYYRSYGLAWRENLWLDVDQGVNLLTSHMRGGGDFRCHWNAWWVGGYGWPGMPPRNE